jgi:hypothetical protein
MKRDVDFCAIHPVEPGMNVPYDMDRAQYLLVLPKNKKALSFEQMELIVRLMMQMKNEEPYHNGVEYRFTTNLWMAHDPRQDEEETI